MVFQMARVRVEDIESYLGKPVSDPYGRRVGFIVGFFSDSDGNVTSLEVSFSDLELKEITIERFVFDNGEAVLIPEWEFEARMVEGRLERLRKRIVALNDLYAKKEIPRHTYEEFKKKIEDELLKMKEDAKNVRDKLKERLQALDSLIAELEKTATALKMSYLAGEISEKTYKAASEQIKKCMDYTLLERESVKKHIELIEKLEKQPIDIGVAAAQAAPQQAPVQVQNQSIPVVVLES